MTLIMLAFFAAVIEEVINQNLRFEPVEHIVAAVALAQLARYIVDQRVAAWRANIRIVAYSGGRGGCVFRWASVHGSGTPFLYSVLSGSFSSEAAASLGHEQIFVYGLTLLLWHATTHRQGAFHPT
jgi:hypothetical protein